MTAQTHTRAVQEKTQRPNGSSAGSHLPPPESRGRLVLSDTVIEKIAAQLVADSPGVGGTRSGFMGFGGGDDFDARPKVSVALSGRTASITAHIGLSYPTDIRAATEDLRQLLIREVGRLTGVDVRQVDIHVAWLRSADHRTDRRLL